MSLSAYKRFLATFNRKEDELLNSDVLQLPGAYKGEREFIEWAEKEYQRDKHWMLEIKKEECALIVVDMQEDFVAPRGAMRVPEAYRQVPRIKRLIEVCRKLKIPVIYTVNTVDPDCCHDLYKIWPPLKAGALRDGKPGTDIYSELYPQPGERVIRTKHSYSSFEATNLDYILRDLGIKTVIICGTMTNFCCEMTARDAFHKHYHVVFGSDVNSSDSALAHEATLRTLRRGFARILSHRQIIEILEKGDYLYQEAIQSTESR